MIKRTIEISREPTHLAARDEQLLILRRSEPPRPLPANPSNLAGRIPFEDLGLIMADERDTTYTHTALVKLAEYGGALVVCGRDHLPCGMYLPLSTNTEVFSRLKAQIAVRKPVRKRAWACIIAAKFAAQADNLDHAPEVQAKLRALAARVRSGDPDNIEAQASQLYWPALFKDLTTITSPFRRRPGDLKAAPPNNLLDYGYAAIRAAVARAIVAGGLLPTLGIKHANRSNAFALADDLMELIRPFTDRRVRELTLQGRFVLDQSTKADLLILLTGVVEASDTRGPLQVALARYVGSFVECLEKGVDAAASLAIPNRIGSPPVPEPSFGDEARNADLLKLQVRDSATEPTPTDQPPLNSG